MKLFIASDIHGSMYYCAQMLEAFEKEKADRLVLLGDILYHGPRNDLPMGYEPKAVIEALNAYSDKIICVRGNCDTEVDQMVLSFPVLTKTAVIFDGERVLYLNHGHDREILENSLPEGSVLICGHTHVPTATQQNGHWYINPGSVSIPKENSAHSYMTYEDGLFTWKTLGGEMYNTMEI